MKIKVCDITRRKNNDISRSCLQHQASLMQDQFPSFKVEERADNTKLLVKRVPMTSGTDPHIENETSKRFYAKVFTERQMIDKH
jgi:hypothetical protein